MPRPVFIPVEGTGSPGPFDWGFPQDMAWALSDPWADILAQFRGEQFANVFDVIRTAYPAATFPMGPSVQTGVQVVLGILNRLAYGTKYVLCGYSQGALVVDLVWRWLLKNDPRRAADCIGIINFGDPMRSPGICAGNLRAGFAAPAPLDGFATGGIAGPTCLTPDETPDFLMSCNNDGDLYGAAPVGLTPWVTETGVGHDETMIFNLVQNFDGTNLLALAEECMQILGVLMTGGLDLTSLLSVGTAVIGGALGSGGIPGIPSSGVSTPNHVVSLLLALLNGGMFVLRGFGPHGDYAKMVPAMVDFALEVGAAA